MTNWQYTHNNVLVAHNKQIRLNIHWHCPILEPIMPALRLNLAGIIYMSLLNIGFIMYVGKWAWHLSPTPSGDPCLDLPLAERSRPYLHGNQDTFKEFCWVRGPSGHLFALWSSAAQLGCIAYWYRVWNSLVSTLHILLQWNLQFRKHTESIAVRMVMQKHKDSFSVTQTYLERRACNSHSVRHQ